MLKFTDFVGGRKSAEMASVEGSSAILASFLQKSSIFFCPMCQSNQALQSAEEFGTHVATCTGPEKTSSNGGNGGGSRGKVGYKKSSLDEFVRSLRAGFDAVATTTVTTDVIKIRGEVETEDGGEQQRMGLEDMDESEIIEGGLESGTEVVDFSIASDMSKCSENDICAEQLVREYLRAHDDSTIDYDLILELLRLLISANTAKMCYKRLLHQCDRC